MLIKSKVKSRQQMELKNKQKQYVDEKCINEVLFSRSMRPEFLESCDEFVFLRRALYI